MMDTNEKICHMEMEFKWKCWMLLPAFILVWWNPSVGRRMKATFEHLHLHDHLDCHWSTCQRVSLPTDPLTRPVCVWLRTGLVVLPLRISTKRPIQTLRRTATVTDQTILHLGADNSLFVHALDYQALASHLTDGEQLLSALLPTEYPLLTLEIRLENLLEERIDSEDQCSLHCVTTVIGLKVTRVDTSVKEDAPSPANGLQTSLDDLATIFTASIDLEDSTRALILATVLNWLNKLHTLIANETKVATTSVSSTGMSRIVARRAAHEYLYRSKSVLPTARNRFLASNDLRRASLWQAPYRTAGVCQKYMLNTKTEIPCENEAYPDRCWMFHLMNYLSQNKSDFLVLLFRGFQVNTKNDFCRVVELCANTGKTFHDDRDGISPCIRLNQSVFILTEHPKQFDMALHNELSYSPKMLAIQRWIANLASR